MIIYGLKSLYRQTKIVIILLIEAIYTIIAIPFYKDRKKIPYLLINKPMYTELIIPNEKTKKAGKEIQE